MFCVFTNRIKPRVAQLGQLNEKVKVNKSWTSYMELQLIRCARCTFWDLSLAITHMYKKCVYPSFRQSTTTKKTIGKGNFALHLGCFQEFCCICDGGEKNERLKAKSMMTQKLENVDKHRN